MKPNMSKTAALAMARLAVGHPIRQSSTSYVVYCPYRSTEPDGPTTEVRRSSYPRIAEARAGLVAEVALYAMYHGLVDEQDLWSSLLDADDCGGSAEERLRASLAQLARAIEQEAA